MVTLDELIAEGEAFRAEEQAREENSWRERLHSLGLPGPAEHPGKSGVETGLDIARAFRKRIDMEMLPLSDKMNMSLAPPPTPEDWQLPMLRLLLTLRKLAGPSQPGLDIFEFKNVRV